MPSLNCSSYSSSSSSASLPHLSSRSPRTVDSGPVASSPSKPNARWGRTSSDHNCKEEAALGSMKCALSVNTPTKSSDELKREIAILEVEILFLERYLLSLYRTVFEDHLPSSVNIKASLGYTITSSSPSVSNQLHHSSQPPERKAATVHHVQPSPSRGSFISDNQRNSSSFSKMSMGHFQKQKSSSGHRSLADHLGASLMENGLSSPGRLSEDIVRCISSIYCKLASATQADTGSAPSPTSSLSSSSIFSSKNPNDNWSPHYNEEATETNQFKWIEEDEGSQTPTVEVLNIDLDDDSFNYAGVMLQKFRSLVRNLEKVEPKKMRREEKLAFWINIHNALVMHSYLAYGTHNRVKSTSALKAAYNIGGHSVDAYTIQSSILRIRPHHSAPLLRTLLFTGRKSKAATVKHVYALEYPEPLVHFALSSGVYSDPVVRAYTASNIFKDLKRAKEEFIQAHVYADKETRIFLPKILYYFAKDMSLDMSGVLEDIYECLTEAQQQVIQKCTTRRGDKRIHWLPQTSVFRYVIHGGLAREEANV